MTRPLGENGHGSRDDIGGILSKAAKEVARVQDFELGHLPPQRGPASESERGPPDPAALVAGEGESHPSITIREEVSQVGGVLCPRRKGPGPRVARLPNPDASIPSACTHCSPRRARPGAQRGAQQHGSAAGGAWGRIASPQILPGGAFSPVATPAMTRAAPIDVASGTGWLPRVPATAGLFQSSTMPRGRPTGGT